MSDMEFEELVLRLHEIQVILTCKFSWILQISRCCLSHIQLGSASVHALL